jgi:hypothetical protein
MPEEKTATKESAVEEKTTIIKSFLVAVDTKDGKLDIKPIFLSSHILDTKYIKEQKFGKSIIGSLKPVEEIINYIYNFFAVGDDDKVNDPISNKLKDELIRWKTIENENIGTAEDKDIAKSNNADNASYLKELCNNKSCTDNEQLQRMLYYNLISNYSSD